GTRPRSNLRQILEEHVLVHQVTGEDRQARPANRTRLRTHSPFNDIGNDYSLQIEPFHGVDRGCHQSLANPGRKAAIEDGGAEIDDRGCGDNRLRQRRSAVLYPLFQRLAEVDPVVGGVPQGLRVDATLLQQVLQYEDRRDIQQLACLAVLAAHRQGPDRAGGPRPSGKDGRVEDDPAADERTDEQVDEVGIGWSDAEDEFRTAGAGGIVLEVNRMAHTRCHFRLEIEILPGIHRSFGRTDLVGPTPEFEWRCDAYSGNPVTLVGIELALEPLYPRTDDPHDLVRLRVGVGLVKRAEE